MVEIFHQATLHPQWHMLPQRLLEEIHRITPVSAQAATGVQLEASKDKQKSPSSSGRRDL